MQTADIKYQAAVDKQLRERVTSGDGESKAVATTAEIIPFPVVGKYLERERAAWPSFDDKQFQQWLHLVAAKRVKRLERIGVSPQRIVQHIQSFGLSVGLELGYNEPSPIGD
jgi:hypothetical protein